ncbi:Aspartyl-tRNA(Asn) amidotransferase subunit C @ Glutamyl-tRNA(Gln) amidotransferase subunit C [hydrothermal vent metagenome]|uniref:Aspartyl-tRNA(Asn) amidotransferase subunit C @ Glutamyl-tRNA(Gln) amidotransferase subunit C n=1 Tax=hydrothermal vent metagenome TaxID=652676 RepID=A0A3B0RS52_9ZZZZ
MAVTAENVKKIARLARLDVPDARLEPLAAELNGLLGWIEQLNEVDVDGVEPMTSAVEMQKHLRKDVVTDGDIRDDILANAPKSEEGFFVVPKAVE